MKQYTWDEYYEKFYDWEESTQVDNLSGVISLGSADEVGEIIIELQANVHASNCLLEKAVEAKLAFSASDLIEFFFSNDKTLATAALYNSVSRLSSEDMQELYDFADDDDIIKICNERNFVLPEYLRKEEDDEEDIDNYTKDFVPKAPAPKLGALGTLASFLVGASVGMSKSQKRQCNGDCANCPPHYGYRHGRWYYGHDHLYGCEFGGNKGSGSMD